MTMVLDTVLRSSLVLTIGFAIAIGLRRQPAALRHWVLAASIVLAAGQPAITRLLPSWTISPSLISSFEEVVPASPLVNTTTEFEILNNQPRSTEPARRSFARCRARDLDRRRGIEPRRHSCSALAGSCGSAAARCPRVRVWLDAEAAVRSALGLPSRSASASRGIRRCS